MTQLSFPSEPAPSQVAALLALINGDPVHDADRAAIVDTIVDVARDCGGIVDPNRVRDRLPVWVYPRCIGPVYSTLARRGYLQLDGWTVNRDVSGKNAGKPTRRYRLTANP